MINRMVELKISDIRLAQERLGPQETELAHLLAITPIERAREEISLPIIQRIYGAQVALEPLRLVGRTAPRQMGFSSVR
jgi:hypothetical protein